MNLEAKKCPRCLVLKDASEFYLCTWKGKEKLSSYCKLCQTEAQKDWRLEHPDWSKEYQKKYRIRNLERVRKWDKNKYYRNHEKSVFATNRARARRVLGNSEHQGRRYVKRPKKHLDISLGGK